MMKAVLPGKPIDASQNSKRTRRNKRLVLFLALAAEGLFFDAVFPIDVRAGDAVVLEYVENIRLRSIIQFFNSLSL